jgi:APA family basic amino acid/polyamine antiporter
VDEARAIDAAAIVMTPPRRTPGGSLLGRTIESVLEDRPCRIIVEAPPATGPAAAKTAA